MKSEHSAALSKAVQSAKAEMNQLKAEKKAEMNDVVTKKLATADANIKDLKWNYSSKVEARLDLQQPGLDAKTKDRVLWKLKNKKHNFFAAIWDIRKELGSKLAAAKASLWRELQAESDKLWSSLNSSTNRLNSESQRISRELWNESNALRKELETRGQEAAEWLSQASNIQADILRDFLDHHKAGHGHGGVSVHDFAPWQVIRPVFGLLGEPKHIEDKIYQMAEELMPVYEETVRGELAQGEAVREYLGQRVISENTDLIDELNAGTDALIDNLMIQRADAEDSLQAEKTSLIQLQVDQVRDLEARVLADKASILEQIADLAAQIKKNEYGTYGKDVYEIKEQIDALKEQWKGILQAARDEFAALQAGSLGDWESELAGTRDYVDQLLAEKETNFAEANGFATSSWEAALAAARDEFDTRITGLLDTMAAQTAEKQAAVQAMYDDLAAQIENLYAKHETKKALKRALDEKRAAIDQRCQRTTDEIKLYGPQIRSQFANELDKENKRFWAVSKAKASQCDAAVSQERWVIQKSTKALDWEFDKFQAAEKKDWWAFIKQTEQKFNELAAKKDKDIKPHHSHSHHHKKHHDKHVRIQLSELTDELDKPLWDAYALLDDQVDDLALSLSNTSDNLVNLAEEQAAAAKASMAAQLAAALARFQESANA